MTMEQREDPPPPQARSTPHPLPARSSVPEQGPTSLPLSPCPSAQEDGGKCQHQTQNSGHEHLDTPTQWAASRVRNESWSGGA